MKLQHKLALYNTFTKIAIIAIISVLTLTFIDRVSINHLQKRLIDKRDKLVSDLSEKEINDLMQKEESFTDYNILKEEYIILTLANPDTPIPSRPVFTQEDREIDGTVQEYLIITTYFRYSGDLYCLEIGETIETLKQLENIILYFTLLTLIIAVALSIIADFAFTKVLLAPFYKIMDQKINKVDDPIHFNYSQTPTTTDDFKLLDQNINTLMKRISDQILIEKQFITNVSHELLTPISILRTRLENMLNDEGFTVDSQTKIVASLKTLNRLKGIINSLLLISKVENNQFTKTDLVLIPSLISDIYEELEDRLLEKNIRFETHLEHNFEFTGSLPLMHTLGMNLINNAIKYNKKNGRISISDKLTPAEYQLFIADEGIGMDPEQIKNAFTRFEKVDSDDNNSYGLGLAIAKSITAFHHISIHITSQKDMGTTVTLSFSLENN